MAEGAASPETRAVRGGGAARGETHRDTGGRARSPRRALAEIAIAFGLIMAVIWTPRPAQRYLWMIAAAAVATITCVSFDGAKAMGLRGANFLRSLWIAGAALALAGIAIALAATLGTLRMPHGVVVFLATYCAYAVWSGVQQFLLQCFFLLRFLRLIPNKALAALATATLFAVAHLPNPILAPVTLLWGFAACLHFLRYRNLYPLAIAHAILGITLAMAIPGPVDHNMRVGLGYLTYSRHHLQERRPHAPDSPLAKPQ
jgi:Type II CAAX prenyl endopeptidase Rce1-like